MKMPRFFAVNYINEAVSYHRKLLNRMILTVPQEAVDFNGFTEIDCSGHKKPWINGKYFELSETQIEAEIDRLTSSKSEVLTSETEAYISETKVHEHAFGTFEIVPSSNPDSQESVDEGMLVHLCEIDGSQSGWETYTKEAVAHYKEDYSQQCQELVSLEAPIESHSMMDFLNSLPKPDSLLKKLKPKVVRDPFVVKDGKTIINEDCFSGEKEYKLFSPILEQVTFGLEEVYTKDKMVNEEYELLEEKEVSFISENTSNKYDILKDTEENVCQNIIDMLETESIHEDSEGIECVMAAGSQIVTIHARESDFLKQDGQVWFDQVGHFSMEKAFPEISKEGGKDNHERNCDKYLESPGSIIYQNDLTSDTAEVEKPWLNEHSFQMLMTCGNGKTFSEEDIILTSQEKNNLHDEFRNHEKYFDDILALALSVPSVENISFTTNQPSYVKVNFNVSKEECSTALELDLPWDPLIEKSEVLKGTIRSEKLIYEEHTFKEEQLNEWPSKKESLGSKEVDGVIQFSLFQEDILNVKTQRQAKEFSISKEKAVKTNGLNVKSAEDINYTCLPTKLTIKQITGKTDLTELKFDKDPIEDFIFLRHGFTAPNTAAKHTLVKENSSQKLCTQQCADKLTKSPLKMTCNSHAKGIILSPCVNEAREDALKKKRDGKAVPTNDEDQLKSNDRKSTEQKGSVSNLINTKQAQKLVNCSSALNNENATIVEVVQNEKDKEGTAKPLNLHKSDSALVLANPHGNRKNAKKIKSNILQVDISEPFLEIASLIEKSAEPFLSLLKTECLIPSTQEFLGFTTDVSRYIVKQHEKARKDETSKDNSTYQAVVALHALVCTADALLHCTLQCAIIQLGAMEDKFGNILGDIFGDLREKLKETFLKHQYLKVVHPKILQLCDVIKNWYVRKQTKSPELDIKVLVITKYSMVDLLKTIASSLCKIEGISAVAESRYGQLSYHQIIDSLDKHNCIVVYHNQMGEEFPWAQFSLVVEYQYVNQSKILESCKRQSIRYIGLQVMPFASKRNVAEDFTDDCVEVDSVNHIVNKDEDIEEFTLIGSQNLTACGDLLHILESRSHIQIIERDYSALSIQVNFADVIIDERTGIVLQDLSCCDSDTELTQVITRVKALSLQLEMCWVIMHYGSSLQKHPNSEGMISAISKSLITFASSQKDYSVKVLYADNHEETSMLMISICENAMMKSQVWKKDDWMKRSWLLPDISQGERILLKFPCLNSFSVQMMLNVGSLTSLGNMSLQELSSKCPWLPVKVLEMFHVMVNSSQTEILQNNQTPDCTEFMSPIQGTNHPEEPKSVHLIKSTPELVELFSYKMNSSEDSHIHKQNTGEQIYGLGYAKEDPSETIGTQNSQVSSQIMSQASKPNEFERATIENRFLSRLYGDYSFNGEEQGKYDKEGCTAPSIPPKGPEMYGDHLKGTYQGKEYSSETYNNVRSPVQQKLSAGLNNSFSYDNGKFMVQQQELERIPHLLNSCSYFGSESTNVTGWDSSDAEKVSANHLETQIKPHKVSSLVNCSKEFQENMKANDVRLSSKNFRSQPSVQNKLKWDNFATESLESQSFGNLPVPKGQKDPKSKVFRDTLNSAKLWHEFGAGYIGEMGILQGGTPNIRKREIRSPGRANNGNSNRIMQQKQREKTNVGEFVVHNQCSVRPMTFHDMQREAIPSIQVQDDDTSNQLSQDSRPRTPSIAPVTPCVRQPLPPSSNYEGNVSTLQNKENMEMRRLQSHAGKSMKVQGTEGSPPMDYDSDDDIDMSVYMHPQTPFLHSTPRSGFQRRTFTTSSRNKNEMMPNDMRNKAGMNLTPSKHRRLTYEKVPGNKSGQTRLNFA